LLDTVVAVIHEDDASAGSGAIDVEAPVARRLVPEWMLTLASRVGLFFLHLYSFLHQVAFAGAVYYSFSPILV
jgi:hypothetical protein